MKPAPFAYLRAASAEEALSALNEFGGDSRILAGGQSLMPMLAMRIVQPSCLIDISRTEDLNYIRVADDHLTIGAAATQATVEWRPTLAQEVPLLKIAFPWISHFQIRNRGTLCGSMAHADPSAELPLCLLALGGELLLRSHRAQRIVPAKEFFQGMLQTALESSELLVEVHFPLRQPGQRYGFTEFAQRHGDFAIVAVAAVVTDNAIRLAVGGVEDRPHAINWPNLNGSALSDALDEFSKSLDARDDPHASAEYRRHLVRELGRRAISEAC